MQVFQVEISEVSRSSRYRVLYRSNVHGMIQDVLLDLSEMGAQSRHIH